TPRARRALYTLSADHRSPPCGTDEIPLSTGDSQRASVLHASDLSAKTRPSPPRQPPLVQPQKSTERAGKKSGKGSKPTKVQATRSVKNRTMSSFATEASSSG